MKIDFPKTQSCTFTGHRDIEFSKIRPLKVALRDAILQCYNEGVTNFICGMALGFDMMAAEIVLNLRDECPDITLTAVVPFDGQEDRWRPSEQHRYDSILDEADQVIILSERYFKGCEMKRNAFMANGSCRVIAYFNGEPHGGTYYTFKSANEAGQQVVNLYR